MRLTLCRITAILIVLFLPGFVKAQVPEGYTWQDVYSVNFGEGANHFSIEAASFGMGGEVELRVDSPDGMVIGRAYFHHTGSSYLYPDSSVNFMDYDCDLNQIVSGTHDVYMNFQDYSEPVLGGVLNIGDFEFDLVEIPSFNGEDRLHVYPPVPGLEPSPYYEYYVQKVSELNSSNLADVSNWETPFAWFTRSPDYGTVGYGYSYAIGGWSHTYTNFELDANTPIIVKIIRKTDTGDDAPSGPITSAVVHPAHMVDSCEIINGEVYVKISQPALFTVDIDGQLDTRNAPRARDGWDSSAFPYRTRKKGCHAVSVFANPFIEDKPDPADPGVLVVKAGELIPDNLDELTWDILYFEPGVHKTSVDLNDQGELVDRLWEPEDVITLEDNKSIYIPGNAIVYGNFTDYRRSNNKSENIRVYGHGTICGSKILHWTYWTDYPNNEYPHSEWHKAVSVRDAKNVRFEGITLTDPANHTMSIGSNVNEVYPPNYIKWAKVIGWRPNSDATSVGGHTYVEDCFLRTQDDGHYIGGALPLRRIVFWHDINGATFRGDFTTRRFSESNAPNVPKDILIEDIDVIYARGIFGFSDTPDFAVIQGKGGGNKTLADGVENTGQMVHFRNINVSDPKPVRHLFGMEADEDNIGDLAGLRFENVTYQAKQTFGWKGGILGTSKSAYRNLVFDNVSVDGQKVDAIFLNNPDNLKTNEYLYDMTYRIHHKIPSNDYTLITTATNGSILVDTVQGTSDKVTVTAIPKKSYRFSGWSGALTGTDSIATITMDKDKGITANFSLITYTISTTAINGQIMLEPALDSYKYGEVVTVKAVGNLGYEFASWGGDLSGDENSVTITMDGDKSISAFFDSIPTYNLSTNVSNGSITLDPAGGIYNEGTVVKVTNTADFGYLFSGWSGDLSGSEASTTIAMDADKNITANFDFIGGAIASFAVNCGGSAYTATDGTQYSADKNYSGGNTYSTGSAISGSEDDKLYQTERYGSLSYTIDLPNGLYEITLMFAEIYHTQPNQRFFNVTIEGLSVISNLDIWSEVGKNAAYNKTYTFNIDDGQLNIGLQTITDNAKISAIKVNPVFNGTAFKLESQSTNGSVIFDPPGTNFIEGTEVTLTAIPEEGFRFDAWSGDLSGDTNPSTIIMSTDKNVTASFSPSTGTIDFFSDIPGKTALMQNYPNPFSTKTTIPYQLKEASDVELTVYDLFGRKVAVLVNEHQSAGYYTIDWFLNEGNRKQLSNGLYIYQLKTNSNSVQLKKASLMK